MQLCMSLDPVCETLEIQLELADASANSLRRTAEKRVELASGTHPVPAPHLVALPPSAVGLSPGTAFPGGHSTVNFHPLHLPKPLPRDSQQRALGLRGPGWEISPTLYQPWRATAQVHLPLGLGGEGLAQPSWAKGEGGRDGFSDQEEECTQAKHNRCVQAVTPTFRRNV